MRTSRAALELSAPGLGFGGPGGGNANSPFSTIEVRMVPENVTIAPRTIAPEAESGRPSLAADRLVMVKRGEGLDEVLASAGVGKDVAASVKAAFRGANLNNAITE